jgi:UDP-N-acetylmuramoylalanine--D-glutamate ligase
MVTITGTDGKTTVTTLATAMVNASGKRGVDAGNTDLPLVSALDSDAEVFVIEATSFRLRWLTRFRSKSATWLNLAPDHLDWHGDVDRYVAAKARVFEFQRADDVAIGFADDPIVMDALRSARARHVTFGRDGTPADYFERDGILHGPRGPIVAVDELWRSFPHDRTNALAAAATVLEAGVATIDGVRSALREFRGIAHRIMVVAEVDGVRYYDDSKATTPHAAVTAIRGFDSVVLIAGGRNKALDLSTMAIEPGRMRAVVAIGDSAPDVVRAFTGICPVTIATSMDEAVHAARDAARPGDSVLLSPGCASFDWYRNYGERGDDFARAARELAEHAASDVTGGER